MARRPTPRPVAAPQPTARELLFETWPGRLFLISAAVKVVVALWRATGALPSAARVASAIATIGLVIAVGVFAWRLFVQIKRRLLWRVRRKLILSYIFIGVIPSLLILVFFLFAGSIVFMNVSAYLFKDGYDGVIENARVSAQAAAMEIARNPSTAAETVQRVYRIRATTYPNISVAYLTPGGGFVTAGRWTPLPPPPDIPGWMKEELFAGSIGIPVQGSAGEEDLVVRAMVKVGSGGAVVVDIPLDEQVTHRLHETTGVRLENVFDQRVETTAAAPSRTLSTPNEPAILFEKSLARIDVYDWTSGASHRDTVALSFRLRALYNHLSSAQSLVLVSGMRFSDA